MAITGAQAVLHTLVGAGITTCFANPGTSEIQFVAALDSVTEMRPILTLFEGVATGAADGYARMTRSPAATLLHLGPGLGNGLANLHNARRARVPVVNLVGDHATHHTAYDTPLQSDIETIARNVSAWVRTPSTPAELMNGVVEAVAAALTPPGRVATLIVPADLAWQAAASPAARDRPPAHAPTPGDVIERVATAIRGGGTTALLLGGEALREPGLILGARIAAATGARLLAERHFARLERGAGLPAVERLAYWPELVTAQLKGVEHLILAGASAPVSFFAYPDQESRLAPAGCDVHELALPPADVVGSLAALVDALGAGSVQPVLEQHPPTARPAGPLTADNACRAIGALLPEGAILSDEAMTSAATLAAGTAGSPRHDWLALSGGAIGQGLPVAVGAAVACPDRPVIALEADGSALYTIQSLWTMAREQLDVTVVIFNNGGYKILATELNRLNEQVPGARADSLIDLGAPSLDFVKLGCGHGVPSQRVEDAATFADALARALADPGPHLIEAMIQPAT